jgi:hypothetical protein
MPKGICNLSIIPIRFEPKSESELVSQLLFGETYFILDQTENWIKIKTQLDDYTGWISGNQFLAWDENEKGQKLATLFPYIKAINQITQTPLYILPGSVLQQWEVTENGIQCAINSTKFLLIAKPENFEQIPTNEIGKIALDFSNSPYLWGGKTMWGIDCSGFSQLLYKLIGIQLPRDAYQQVKIGEQVDFVNKSKLGDLAFFDNEAGKITHVGMVIGPGEIIHASGKVRIDMLDSFGIFHSKLGKHTHKLRSIKRILV